MDKNLNFSLNVNDYQTDDFSPVPEGEYSFCVKKVERLALKNDPDASRLAVSCEILGPNYAGRIIFSSFNLWHPSADTSKFALEDVARLAKACGIQELTNLAELEGKTFSATCEIDSNNYNRLKKFKPASGAIDTSSTLSAGGSKPQPAAGPSQQQGINTKKKPW